MAFLRSIFSILSLAIPCAGQVTINVPADFPTIQRAIDFAIDGDNVLVAPGVYVESVGVLGKEILVRSAMGADATHIVWTQVGAIGGVVRLDGTGTSAGPVLEGFTVRDSNEGLCAIGPATVRGCVIRNNLSPGIFTSGLVHVESCQIVGNTGRDGSDVNSSNSCTASPNGEAGGIHGSGFVFCRNCLIVCNTGGDAGQIQFPCSTLPGDGGPGGIYNNGGAVRMMNCTIAGNVGGATFFGQVGAGGLDYHIATGSELMNCILQANSLPELQSHGLPFPPVFLLRVEHSNVAGYTGPGTGNIDADPLFVDPMNGDHRLTASSPCRDTGDSTILGLPLEDLAGSPRVVGADVDMGAYEYVAPLPGTQEGVELRTTIDGRGADLDRKFAFGGSDLITTLEDDGGAFAGAVPVLLGQVFPDGAPPSGLPALAIHLDPLDLAIFYDGNATPGPLLGSMPITWGPVALPHGLDGLCLRLQAFGLTSSAANANFVATHARDLVFLN